MKHFLMIFLFFFSCKVASVSSKRVTFKDKFEYYGKEINQKYSVDVPKNGILKKSRYDFTGEDRLEYRIVFPDSSVYFINNNFDKISRLNMVNMYELGINALRKKQEFDTLQYKGIQKNGRFWKEQYLGSIVIGYSNVRPNDSLRAEAFCLSLRKL